MFAHITMVSIPIGVGYTVVLRCIHAFVEFWLEKKNKGALANLLNLFNWSAVFSGITAFSILGPQDYCYISKGAVVLAVVIDIFAVAFLASWGYSEVIKPYLASNGEISAFYPGLLILTTVFFVIHLLLSVACIAGFDWVFRPLVGQRCLDGIAIMREKDAIERGEIPDPSQTSFIITTGEGTVCSYTCQW